ncbi:MAG: RluA family pseudouridine synthase [Candidatus Eisenbacteria bacterium]|nr:RluA family pseudouridine synthase [Candidatus Eisenbacteria bacterium]
MKFTEWPSKIDVLFEDDYLIAVVKPAGLTTANAPAGKPSLFTWLKTRLGPVAFVGIVSRLDAPVSGVVVVAKTSAAADGLAAQFRERRTGKRYVAIVTGRFPAPISQWVEWHDWLERGPGRKPSRIVPMEIPEGRGPSRGKTEETLPQAQEAHARARVVRRGGETSLVELEPVTGRRHQLRVQLAARGCPIVGDRLYGSRLPFPEPGGIALHASRLEIEHPATKTPIILSSPLPAEWKNRFGSLVAGWPWA